MPDGSAGEAKSLADMLPEGLTVAALNTAFESQAPYIWIRDPKARCLSEGETGFIFSPSRRKPESRKPLVYFTATGASFDPLSGFVTERILGSDYFGEAHFRELVGEDYSGATGTIDSGLINRAGPSAHLIANYHLAIIPGCSGDVFLGSQEDGPEPSLGLSNVERAMRALRRALTAHVGTLKELILAGASSGAIGAVGNSGQAKTIFPEARRRILADSAMVFPDEFLPPCLQLIWHQRWNLAPLIESTGCSQCSAPNANKGGLYDAMEHVVSRTPGDLFAFISSAGDSVMRWFFWAGIAAHNRGLTPASRCESPTSVNDGQSYTQAVTETLERLRQAGGNVRHFLLEHEEGHA